MRFQLLPLISAALLGFVGQTTSAQTFMTDVRDPQGLTVEFYRGNGTAIDYSTNLIGPSDTAFIDHSVGSWEFWAWAYASLPTDHPRFGLDLLIYRSNNLIYFSLSFSPAQRTVPLNEFAGKLVIGGLFPSDPAYQVASLSFDPSQTDVSPDHIRNGLFTVDGVNGTLTVQLPMSVVAFNCVFSGANFVIEETPTVPEPVTAALLLSLGAAAFVSWRKLRIRPAANSN